MNNKMEKGKKIRLTILILIMVLFGALGFNGCVHAPYVLPEDQRTNDPSICFERDILPLFVSNCAKSGCHNAQSHEDGYVLESYATIMKKGIVPGNIAGSKIWESITTNSGEEGKMPLNAPELTSAQLDLIKRWIVAGATDSGACGNTCDSNNYTYTNAIRPLMQTYCVGCHSSVSSAGGSLNDYTSVKNAAVNGRMIGSISHLSGYNPMPTGGMKLSDCQITQVKKWVAAGALNN